MFERKLSTLGQFYRTTALCGKFYSVSLPFLPFLSLSLSLSVLFPVHFFPPDSRARAEVPLEEIFRRHAVVFGALRMHALRSGNAIRSFAVGINFREAFQLQCGWKGLVVGPEVA